MYFKRIELNGFKSFADPVTVEFSDGITCIVGPNGSGKSNVSDAIRWVLGEQSPKMLRGGKMEEVIFAGTESRKPKGMAEVTLVIDNSEHILPIDYAEVGITRRMYRSGESEYMINRNPCRLRDIRDLIMDTGIGVEGYSIIGQGKIADIVSNKMESRREIFEEAAGIVKYRTKKAEAERKLESASGNLARVNDIVSEIEGRIDGLREESLKASEYLEIKEKYRDVEINIILKSIEQAAEKSAAVREEFESAEKAIAESEALKAENEKLLSECRAKGQSLDERIDALRDELLAKTEEIHQISGRSALNKERVSTLEKDKDRISAEITAAKEKLAREQAAAAEYDKKQKEQDEQYSKCKAVSEEKHAALEVVNSELLAAENKLNSAKDLIFELAGKEAGSKAEIQSIESLKDTLSRRKERLLEDDGLVDKDREKLKAEFDSCTKEKEELEKESDKLSKELADLKTKADSAALSERKAASEAEELKLSEGRMSARFKLLEELENSYEGYAGGVRFLMGEKIKGTIGVLGDLLIVPTGWELAIETVLGAKLMDIVVENDSVAKKSIALLKENKAGRLTFLPLDSLRVQNPSSTEKVENCRGFLGLASDSVECRGGYQKIVDYMLGKVVICDNLDNALAMSKLSDGPLRFVTLEGELINAAGAITGGSVKSNTINILSRKAEKDTLEKDLAKIAVDIEKALKRRENSQKELSDIAENRIKIEQQKRDTDMKLAVNAKELESLELMRKDAAAAGEKRIQEIRDLDAEILNAEESVKKAAEASADIIRQSEDAKNSVDLISSELEEIKLRVSAAQEAETSAKMEENGASLKAKNAAEMYERVLSGIKEIEDDIRAREESFEKASLELRQIADFSEGAADILKQKEEEKKSIEEETSRLTAEKAENAKAETDCEIERNTIEKQLYENQLKKHDSDVRLARFDAQTETLKEKLFEEFELSYAQAAELESSEFVMSRALKESREYKERLRELGDVNVGSIEEYKQVKERYDFLIEQRADIMKAADELKSLISDMDKTIKSSFKKSFDSVVENFEISFAQLFKGGHARLSLEDPDNPLECAIEIEAQPPGKKLQNINLLSGGEKTLTAIALMLAVLNSKPTPFCILDEIEAALDEANIDSVARYLRNFGKTQFALITHQKATMEYADILYGVTMPEHGVSKVLSLKLGDDFDIEGK